MITIIGGGPIGTYTSSLLAKKGYDVKIFEEHKKIGLPISCTGIVTPHIKKYIKKIDSCIVNKTDTIRIHAPNNNKLILKKQELVINRRIFDQTCADMASDNGAEIKINHTFLKKSAQDIIIKDCSEKKHKQIRPDYIIGADGPASKINSEFKMNTAPDYLFGIQALVKGRFEKNVYDVFFGNVAPGFFAWIVPESEHTARVGVAGKKNMKNLFNKFLARNKLTNEIERQAGLIPLYNRNRIVKKENITLVGDAASHVKATTGGGLVPGMAAANELAEKIENNMILRNKNLKIDRTLRTHGLVRKTLNRFSEKDFNKLVELCSRKSVARVIEKSDREFPIKMLALLLIKEPRFSYFARHLLM